LRGYAASFDSIRRRSRKKHLRIQPEKQSFSANRAAKPQFTD